MEMIDSGSTSQDERCPLLKVLRGMKRELGLREDRVREFGFFEDGQEDEEEQGAEDPGEQAVAEDQFSASRARTRCGRLSRPPLRISTTHNLAPGGNLDSAPEVASPVAEVVPEVLESPPLQLQSRRNFTPPAR